MRQTTHCLFGISKIHQICEIGSQLKIWQCLFCRQRQKHC